MPAHALASRVHAVGMVDLWIIGGQVGRL